MARSREHIGRKGYKCAAALRRYADSIQAFSDDVLDEIEIQAELSALEAMLYEVGFGGCAPEQATVVIQRNYYH